MAAAETDAQLAALGSMIRKMIANHAEIIYPPHASTEMTNDQVIAADAQFALKG
jgi:hypothetical protein